MHERDTGARSSTAIAIVLMVAFLYFVAYGVVVFATSVSFAYKRLNETPLAFAASYAFHPAYSLDRQCRRAYWTTRDANDRQRDEIRRIRGILKEHQAARGRIPRLGLQTKVD